MFKWHKKGLIFSPAGKSKWMFSHSQCPFSLEFDSFIRVYFSTRENYVNNMSRSHGGFVDLDKTNFKKILRVSERPLMDLGGLGEFDEFGSMPNSIVRHNNEYYLYYCGWNRSLSTPYSWEIGLAKGRDAERFVKVGKGPLIGPTLNEPYLHACPQVYQFGKNEWHMFYLSGQRWLEGDEKIESQYLLVHAISENGITWQRDPRPIIEPKVDFESQTSAAIFYFNKIYHMFFCYRYGLGFRVTSERGYRIGYAWSDDLFNWHRDDSMAGIDVSSEGWDSEMIAYPHIAKIQDKYVMFYCGNKFGAEGFGYAEMEISQ